MANTSVLLFIHERTTNGRKQRQISSVRLSSCGKSKNSLAARIVRETRSQPHDFGQVVMAVMVCEDRTYHQFI